MFCTYGNFIAAYFLAKNKCFAVRNQIHNVVIDLKNINKFIGNPVKYRRDVLEETNDFYTEPDFLKQNRQEAKERGLIK